MAESGVEAAGGTHVTHLSSQEELLTGVWRDVLGRGDIGVDDDFFLIGGHSLHIIRIVSLTAERSGVELPLQFVHDYPTIAAGAVRLAALMDGTEGSHAADAPHQWDGDW